jgi:uncharacterized membrane protein
MTNDPGRPRARDWILLTAIIWIAAGANRDTLLPLGVGLLIIALIITYLTSGPGPR